jgi:hypothetical protein
MNNVNTGDYISYLTKNKPYRVMYKHDKYIYITDDDGDQITLYNCDFEKVNKSINILEIL